MHLFWSIFYDPKCRLKKWFNPKLKCDQNLAQFSHFQHKILTIFFRLKGKFDEKKTYKKSKREKRHTQNHFDQKFGGGNKLLIKNSKRKEIKRGKGNGNNGRMETSDYLLWPIGSWNICLGWKLRWRRRR